MAAALPPLSPAVGLRLTSVAVRTVPLPVTQFGAAPLPVLASKRPTTNARRMPPLGGPAPASTNRCPRPTIMLLAGLARLPCVGRAPPPRMPLALFACVPPVSHASVRSLLRQRRPSAFDAFRSVLNASSPPLPLLLPAALAYSPTSTTASSPFVRCVQDTYQVPPLNWGWVDVRFFGHFLSFFPPSSSRSLVQRGRSASVTPLSCTAHARPPLPCRLQ